MHGSLHLGNCLQVPKKWIRKCAYLLSIVFVTSANVVASLLLSVILTNRTDCQNYKNEIQFVVSQMKALGSYCDRAEPCPWQNLQMIRILKG